MMRQLNDAPDLFGLAPVPEEMLYPNAPGFKGDPDGPGAEAAAKIKPSMKVMQWRVLDILETEPAVRSNGLTPDEIASRLGMSVLSIRPRVSELLKQGKIIRTAERRRNISGLKASVVKIAPDPVEPIDIDAEVSA